MRAILERSARDLDLACALILESGALACDPRAGDLAKNAAAAVGYLSDFIKGRCAHISRIEIGLRTADLEAADDVRIYDLG